MCSQQNAHAGKAAAKAPPPPFPPLSPSGAQNCCPAATSCAGLEGACLRAHATTVHHLCLTTNASLVVRRAAAVRCGLSSCCGYMTTLTTWGEEAAYTLFSSPSLAKPHTITPPHWVMICVRALAAAAFSLGLCSSSFPLSPSSSPHPPSPLAINAPFASAALRRPMGAGVFVPHQTKRKKKHSEVQKENRQRTHARALWGRRSPHLSQLVASSLLLPPFIYGGFVLRGWAMSTPLLSIASCPHSLLCPPFLDDKCPAG